MYLTNCVILNTEVQKNLKGAPIFLTKSGRTDVFTVFLWIKYPTLLNKRPISGLERPWPGPTCGTLGLDIQLPVISILKVARFNWVSLFYARSMATNVFLDLDTQEEAVELVDTS